jgi:hypothetical protein
LLIKASSGNAAIMPQGADCSATTPGRRARTILATR